MQFPLNLPEKKEFDVAGFGTNAVDYLIVVPEYPTFNSKIEIDNYTQLAGGEIASTMAGLSRLGMKTTYAGRFGKEPTGDFGMQSLAEDGVDLRYSEQIDGAQTQIAFILIDKRNGERTVIWKRDEKLFYTPEDAPLEIVRSTKIFHATPHDTAACIKLAREAKKCGAIVSIDIDNIFEGLDEMIPLIDIFISSSDFPEKLVGIKDRRDSLREIKLRYGCAVVGMTLGESGSVILCNDQFIETEGYGVPDGCKDTTGAGDAFRVGLLYGLLNRETLERSAEMANAVAALKCRAVGARTSLPTENEVLGFIRK